MNQIRIEFTCKVCAFLTTLRLGLARKDSGEPFICVHCMVGWGTPVAWHSIDILWPWITDNLSVLRVLLILGGTITWRNNN